MVMANTNKGKRINMKKHIVKTDIADLINKMQQHMVILEKKIDTLLYKPSPGPVETRPFQKPFQQPGHIHGQGGPSQGSGYRERIMHKATCADCRKECEVPFKPSGERPVYCKECFSKRKAGNRFKERPDNRHRDAGPAQMINMGKPHHSEKKRPAAKRRKAKKR